MYSEFQIRYAVHCSYNNEMFYSENPCDIIPVFHNYGKIGKYQKNT